MKITLLLILAAQLVIVPNASAEEATKSIPFDQLGAEAGKDYKGAGLAITPSDGEASLRCDFQKLRGNLTSEGLWLESTGQEAASVPFRVVAQSFGRATLQTLATAGRVDVTSTLARLIRPGLVEEYSVSVDGVRQDFILEEKPGGSGPLRVELSVDGARAESTPGGANLAVDGSGRKLTYQRLAVTDATGRVLAACIEVISTCRLAVIVDDTEATYPIRIDPTFSDADWVSLGGGPGVNGNVFAMARSGSNVYVAGTLTIAGNVFANRIARWNGSAWSALGTGMNDAVYALTVDSSGNLYAGGRFTTAGGVPANRVAKWNGSTWSALGSGADNNVHALAVGSGGIIYMGGEFGSAGGVGVSRTAKWNGSTWSALGPGLDGTVNTMIVDAAGNLYAGGNFSITSSGVPLGKIAKWNGTAWSALGTGMSGSTNGFAVHVACLAVDGSGNLYAGGRFTMAGGVNVNHIAKWNGSSWAALGTGAEADVRSMAFGNSGILYVRGLFASVSGVPANGMAKWSGGIWSAVGTGIENGGDEMALDATGYPYIIDTKNGVHGMLKRWSGTDWLLQGTGTDNAISALAMDSSGNLYLGGDFLAAGNIAANYVAKWNGTTWSDLGAGMNGRVYTLVVNNAGQLYAAGRFTTAGGVAANNIAKWNGTEWMNLGTGTDGDILALGIDNDQNLLAAGFFSNAGGVPANRIAKWNGTAWANLGTGMNNGVNALAFDSTGNTYAGGAFTSAGGLAANRVAKWNGSSWSTLGVGVDGSVYALALDPANNLYVGGTFTKAGGSTAAKVAKWNGSAWSILGTGVNHDVYSLVVDGFGSLFAGGRFTTAGGAAANYVANWDGSNWTALGSGLSGTVNTMVFDPSGRLYIGGRFSQAGGKVAAFLARATLPTPPNRRSTDILATGSSIAENSPPNATVSILTANDPNLGDSHTFSLVPGSGSSDNASFIISGNTLKIVTASDYETRGSYLIRVRATDSGGLSLEESFVITVGNVNEPPTDLSLSQTSVIENLPANTIVGTLSSTDPDVNNIFSYSLVSGNGSTGNAAFTITGADLRINSPLVIATQSSYSIRIRSTDLDGLSFEKNFTITIIAGLVFTDWIASSGLNGVDAAPTATPFNDGVENLLKYAFNMNAAGPDVSVLASSGSSGLPQITVDSSGAEPVLKVAFLRRKGSGLIYTPQRSDTLGSFVPMTETQTVTSIDAQWERVTVQEPAPPATAPSAFVRVQVSLP